MAIKKVEKKEFIDISPIRYENYIDFLLPFDTCYNRIVDECADAHESIEHCIECALSYFRDMLLDDSTFLDYKSRYFYENMVNFLEDKIRDFAKSKRIKRHSVKDRFYMLRALGIDKLESWKNLKSYQKEILISELLDCHPDTARDYIERNDADSEKKMTKYLNQLKEHQNEKKG